MAFAAVFPGQGSQSSGMLADLATQFSEVEHTYSQASDIIGTDLWKIVCDEDASRLNDTRMTQPIMLAAGIAVWRIWLQQGGCQPVAMAGHSLGEYSALVASEILTFSDAMSLVAERARLMQEAVPAGSGAMAAIIGLEDEQIVTLCAQATEQQGGVVEAVNFNSPGQVVIAGTTESVDKAIELLSAAGAKRAIKLPVSVPSHCSLMQPAAEKLAQTLKTTTFSAGNTPVLQNVNAARAATPEAIKNALADQLFKPVLWVKTIQNLASGTDSEAADTIIEFGPGKVLSGLTRRIDRQLKNFTIYDAKTLEQALTICN